MDRYEKFEHWKDIAEYDLGTAEAMLNSGRYLYVVFMCEQAVEKYVKGLYVLVNDAEPPRTHDIEGIFDKISIRKNESFTSQKEKHGQFFQSLRGYYLTDRYPSYHEKLSSIVKEKEAQDILNKTKETLKWLKSLRTLN